MGNMGTIPATGYESSVVQTFSSPTGTSHTMTYAANVSDMVLVINNVIQEPTVAYTTSGTTLTTATLVSGDTMYIIYLALSRKTVTPGADTVTNAMIVDNAINSEHYTDGSIDNIHTNFQPGTTFKGDGSSARGKIVLNCEQNTHGVSIQSPAHSAGATYTLTLPTSDGNAAEHLITDGSGVLSWAAPPGDALDASPNTDHTANGPQTNTLASGYSSTIMDLVYLGSGSKWLEADSDATGTAINLLGIALEAKTDTQAMNVALPGSFVRDDSWSWTPGVPLYMSGTLGAITATKPTGSGDVVRTVGYAVAATYIFFAPSSDYVTLA